MLCTPTRVCRYQICVLCNCFLCPLVIQVLFCNEISGPCFRTHMDTASPLSGSGAGAAGREGGRARICRGWRLAHHFRHCKELAKAGRQALEFKQKGESLAVDLQAGASPDKDGKCLIPAICDTRHEWSHPHHHSLIAAGNSGCPTGTEPTSGRAMTLLLFVWLSGYAQGGIIYVTCCHRAKGVTCLKCSNLLTYPLGPMNFKRFRGLERVWSFSMSRFHSTKA